MSIEQVRWRCAEPTNVIQVEKATDKYREVHPSWVIVSGKRRYVSDFAHLHPSKRPQVCCPVCQHPVTLALGNKNIHHYRHRPSDVCAVSRPETALHLNVKCHVANELEKGPPLFLLQKCNGYYNCGRSRSWLWLEEWDAVHVEFKLAPFRPDIALLQDGRVIGAIEILVIHAIEPEKEAYFDQEKLAWIEVKGIVELHEGEDAWRAGQPLYVLRQRPRMETWVCDECLERAADVKRLQDLREAERLDREQNKPYIYCARLVDYYFPSGKKYREAIYVKMLIRDGIRVKAWGEREGGKRLGYPVVGNPLVQKDFKLLSEHVRWYMADRKSRHGAIIDYPNDWTLWKPGSKFHPADFDRYPEGYIWIGRRWRKKRLKWVLAIFDRRYTLSPLYLWCVGS